MDAPKPYTISGGHERKKERAYKRGITPGEWHVDKPFHHLCLRIHFPIVALGLKEAILVLGNLKGIGMIYLDDKDVIRHKLVKQVIEAYKQTEHHN